MIITPGTPLLGAWLYGGCYSGEAYGIEFTGVFTNTTPTDAYRGAGRPEATYAIERIMDTLAKRVGKDVVEIRRMNFMPASTEPFEMPGGLTIDSSDYESRSTRRSRWSATRRSAPTSRPGGTAATPRRSASGSRPISRCAGWRPSRILGVLRYAAGRWDAAQIRVLPTGKVVLAIGTPRTARDTRPHSAQIVAEDLGLPLDDIEVSLRHRALAVGDGHVRMRCWPSAGSLSTGRR